MTSTQGGIVTDYKRGLSDYGLNKRHSINPPAESRSCKAGSVTPGHLPRQLISERKKGRRHSPRVCVCARARVSRQWFGRVWMHVRLRVCVCLDCLLSPFVQLSRDTTEHKPRRPWEKTLARLSFELQPSNPLSSSSFSSIPSPLLATIFASDYQAEICGRPYT